MNPVMERCDQLIARLEQLAIRVRGVEQSVQSLSLAVSDALGSARDVRDEAAKKRLAESFGFPVGDSALALAAEITGYTSDVKLAESPQGASREYHLTRQIAMFLLRKSTPLSLSNIAALFGLTSHTTVLYAIDRVQGIANGNPEFAATLVLALNALSGSGKTASS